MEEAVSSRVGWREDERESPLTLIFLRIGFRVAPRIYRLEGNRFFFKTDDMLQQSARLDYTSPEALARHLKRLWNTRPLSVLLTGFNPIARGPSVRLFCYGS